MIKTTVALVATVGAICASGWVFAQVAGSVTLGVTVAEQKLIAQGWSAKKQILGSLVYNDANEPIGQIKDMIVAPDRSVSYAIVGVGGFLGIGEHDVLIPVGAFRLEGQKLKLAGATKQALERLPNFEYAH
jgi:hypothetical protein